MAAPLHYLLITVKVVATELVSLVMNKILRLFLNTLRVHDKHYMPNRDNLTQLIQMQLSESQITFFQFIFHIFEIYIKFQTFDKKR